MALARAAGPCPQLTAARTHRIIRICERQGVPTWPISPTRAVAPGCPRASNAGLCGNSTPTEKTVNRALAAARTPVGRGVGCLKS